MHDDGGGEPGVQVERRGMEAHAGNPTNSADLRDLIGRVFEATKTLQKRQCWQLSATTKKKTPKVMQNIRNKGMKLFLAERELHPATRIMSFFLLKAKITSSEAALSHHDWLSLCWLIQISPDICYLCCLFNVIPLILNQLNLWCFFPSCSVHLAPEWMKGFLLQAQACHSGNLHHTVGWDLPQLE